jgi:FKBP-type peptidyl-prolyl cis-trans isomerase
MGKWMMAAAIAAFSLSVAAEEVKELKTQKDIASYAIGVMTARNFQKDEIDVDLDVMMQGMKDALAGGHLLKPEKDLRHEMSGIMAEARKKMVLNRRSAAELNRQAGAKYLADNKTKEGVVTLPSGVQYTELVHGTGKHPLDSDMVEINFRGTLINGTEFDSSESGKPPRLKLSALVTGWREAIKLMTVGSKWKIIVPASAAYGERGIGSEIGPNETLIYETELLGLSR